MQVQSRMLLRLEQKAKEDQPCNLNNRMRQSQTEIELLREWLWWQGEGSKT